MNPYFLWVYSNFQNVIFIYYLHYFSSCESRGPPRRRKDAIKGEFIGKDIRQKAGDKIKELIPLIFVKDAPCFNIFS